MTDTVLLTGVSGFVGLAVAAEALPSGFHVRVEPKHRERSSRRQC